MDDERREVSTSVLSAVAGLLAGIGLGVVAVVAWTDVTDGEDPESVTNQSSLVGQDDAAGTETTGSPVGTTRMERCASAAQALKEPIQTAGPALDQWALHIDAMNQLVVGEITLQQASDFWNRTRVGAQRRVDRFTTAWTALRRDGVDCPPSLFLAPANPALRPCVRQIEAEMGVLARARSSIRMWDQHIQHMDMLRLGTLSPEDATAMWLTMWRQGDRELTAYRDAAREAQTHDGCDEVAPGG